MGTTGGGNSLTPDGVVEFREGQPADPSINWKVTGNARNYIGTESYAAYAVGTLQHPMHFFIFDPPLTERIVEAELKGTRNNHVWEENTFRQWVSPDFHEGVEVTDWAPIPTPPPPAAAPAPAAAAPAAPASPAAPATASAPAAPPAPAEPSTPPAANPKQ